MEMIDLCSESELEEDVDGDTLSDFGSVATDVSVQFVRETTKRARDELIEGEELSIKSESTEGDDA
jgi:hypothetical protein